MAITVCGSCINFGTYNLISCSDGIAVDGVLFHKGQLEYPPNVIGTSKGFLTGACSLPDLTRVKEVFPFASDTNTTDVGNMVACTACSAGSNSDTCGYQMAGFCSLTDSNMIQGFPFASCTSCTDVGNLSLARRNSMGASSSDCGYAMSGCAGPSGYVGRVDAFPFASGGNATCVGEINRCRKDAAGHSSKTCGFVSGGEPITPATTIQSFSFASGTCADHGTLLAGVQQSPAGLSDETHGYNAGGDTPSEPVSTVIQRFPFASTSGSSDVGNLSVGRRLPGGGNSSSTHGYVSGGNPPASGHYDKFAFASSANATCIGTLGRNRCYNTNPNPND